MSVETVTMYQVHCDADGCDAHTGSFDTDYWAWADADQALDNWGGDGGAITRDGKHYCPTHADRVCLECEREGDPEFIHEYDECEACYLAETEVDQ